MKKLTVVLFFSLYSYYCSSQSGTTYFAQYRNLADSLSTAYGIPACVILGVAYLESGGGTSVVAKKLNNHFGIVGNCNYAVSRHKSRYRYYSSIKDSYIGFCKLVASKKMYAQMKGSPDCKLWLKKIAATGYAADANRWTTHVNSTIKKYCQ
ncbi:MAG TPA: muramidase [Crocinitomicaceae bacterium]|nr:muramidase [Crocinitomicaceae bacterium]